jgi:hypothetical protein
VRDRETHAQTDEQTGKHTVNPIVSPPSTPCKTPYSIMADCFHVVWVCNRFAAYSRLRTNAGRLNDHTLDVDSRVRQQIGSRLPGFPWHTRGWASLESAMTAADTTLAQVNSTDIAGHCTGVALLRDPLKYTGPLHIQSEQQRFVFEVTSVAAGMFFEVLEYCELPAPIPTAHLGAQVSPSCSMFSVTDGFVERATNIIASDGRQVGEIVQSWCEEHNVLQGSFNTCWQLWGPVAWALAHAQWRHLFLADNVRIGHDCSISQPLKDAGPFEARLGWTHRGLSRFVVYSP